MPETGNRTKPKLSVIVPAYQGAAVLPHSLGALQRSDLPRDLWELIVVDDGSTDDTAVIASQFADIVVRLPGQPHGPAYARNRGFEVSRGETAVFIDADVCVHTDTLRRFYNTFEARPDVAAVFGSYDSKPSHPGVVSEFRNLLHHFVHHRDAGDAETFWAGCGAIRAAAFREVGMFDEWHYARPQIEDIELGRRLRLAGHRILLAPDIQGKHMKRWTLKDMLTTDFKHRGVPWTRLLLQEGPGSARNILNIRVSERFCTAMAGLGWLGIAAALWLWEAWPLLMVPLTMVAVLFVNLDFYRFIGRERNIGVALVMIPMHVMYYGLNVISAFIGWFLHILLGEPQAPVVAMAASGLDIDVWPPRPVRPEGGIWSPPVRAPAAPYPPPPERAAATAAPVAQPTPSVRT